MNYQMVINRAGDVISGDVGFDTFLEMAPKDLLNLQVKVTYIGEQRKPLPTVVLQSKDRPTKDPLIAAAKVLSMRVAGIDFENDDLTPIFCSATSDELLDVIQNLAQIPTVASSVGA